MGHAHLAARSRLLYMSSQADVYIIHNHILTFLPGCALHCYLETKLKRWEERFPAFWPELHLREHAFDLRQLRAHHVEAGGLADEGLLEVGAGGNGEGYVHV